MAKFAMKKGAGAMWAVGAALGVLLAPCVLGAASQARVEMCMSSSLSHEILCFRRVLSPSSLSRTHSWTCVTTMGSCIRRTPLTR